MIDYRKKTITKGQQQLRCGYTTGTCAAAAAKAAAVALLTGEICRDVAICLPGGENILLETETLEHQKNCVKCGVIKDAGDDPDITNGLMICAAVEKNTSGEICIDGGEGVGRVTQPGLDQPVGAAGIKFSSEKNDTGSGGICMSAVSLYRGTYGYDFHSKRQGNSGKNVKSHVGDCWRTFCFGDNRASLNR